MNVEASDPIVRLLAEQTENRPEDIAEYFDLASQAIDQIYLNLNAVVEYANLVGVFVLRVKISSPPPDDVLQKMAKATDQVLALVNETKQLLP